MEATVGIKDFALPEPRRISLLNPTADFILLVLSPLLVFGSVSVGSSLGWSAVVAWIYSTALGVGHIVPGFWHAYGRRAVFEKYRYRLLTVPFCVFALAWWLEYYSLHALTILIVPWRIWHGYMQIYGMARIYDIKSGDASEQSARWNKTLCVMWMFSTFLIVIPRNLKSDTYQGALILETISQFTLWLDPFLCAATFALTLAWFGRLYCQRFSAMKVAFMLSSFLSLFWFVRNREMHVLMTMCMIEGVHFLQYFLITYVSTIKGDSNPAHLTPLLPQTIRGRVWAVTGSLIAFMAALAYFGESKKPIGTTLVAAILCLRTLHFYFDSFIWKLRELPKDGLGIAPDHPKRIALRRLPKRDAVFQCAAFVMAVATAVCVESIFHK